MRTFEEYMKMPYKLEIIPDTEESGFVASYPELPGCITCGETVANVVANAEDAKKNGFQLPLRTVLKSQSRNRQLLIPVSSNFVFQKLCIKLLPKIQKKEGVSMNQYCVYLLAKNSEKEHGILTQK